MTKDLAGLYICGVGKWALFFIPCTLQAQGSPLTSV
jgi:hypothetical protein